MLLLAGVGLLVVGGAALVYRVAEDQGRNGALWMLVSLVGAAWSMWLTYAQLIASASGGYDVSVGASFAVIGAPVLVHAALAALAALLPTTVRAGRANAWKMVWLASARDTTSDVELRLGDDALTIESSSDAPSVSVRYTALDEAVVDGECVRLRWRAEDGEHKALLEPLEAPKTRDGRARMAAAIAERIDARR